MSFGTITVFGIGKRIIHLNEFGTGFGTISVFGIGKPNGETLYIGGVLVLSQFLV